MDLGRAPNKISRKYVKLKELGKTSNSRVSKRVQMFTCRAVAVKKYRKNACDPEKIKNEVDMLKEVSHDNVVKMIECKENEKNVYIVMEHLRGRTLKEELAMKEKLQPDDVRKIVTSLFSALAHLHSLKICHMDVKTSNVMISKNFNDVKLIDLGNAEKFPGENPLTLSRSGTPRFAAPEFGLSRGCCPFKADIWSLGVVIAHCVSQSVRKINLAVFVADMRNCLKEKLDVECGDEGLVKLVGRMCQYHPNARPSAEKLNDDWLAEKSLEKFTLVRFCSDCKAVRTLN